MKILTSSNITTHLSISSGTKINLHSLTECKFIFLAPLILFLGSLPIISMAQLMHIDYSDMPDDKEVALKIDIGDSHSNSYNAGLRITLRSTYFKSTGSERGNKSLQYLK